MLQIAIIAECQIISFTNKFTIWLLAASGKYKFDLILERGRTFIILYYSNTVANISAAKTNNAIEFTDLIFKLVQYLKHIKHLCNSGFA